MKKSKLTIKMIKNMKKLLFLQLAVALLFVSCDFNQKQKRLSESNDSLRIEMSAKDATISDLLGMMNQIEDGFRKINEIQGRINLSTVTDEVSYSEVLNENIEYITGTLEKNREEIEKLKKQLAGNEKAAKELKAFVENLEKQLNDKSAELLVMQQALADKDIRIGKLDSVVNSLSRINSGYEEKIQEQTNELNAVWYAIGTKKELKAENILTGANLLRSGKVMRDSNANMGYFTQADKRTLNTVETMSKSAKILSNHPEGSYVLERDENKMYVLTILEPDAFWQSTKYLVIQVK